MHRKWMEILDFSAEKITMFLLLLPTKRWSVFRPIFFSCQWICTLLRLRLYPSLLKLSSKKAQKLYISASHARVPPSPPPQPLLSPQKLTRLLLLHFAIQSRNLECEVIKRNIERRKTAEETTSGTSAIIKPDYSTSVMVLQKSLFFKRLWSIEAERNMKDLV